MIKACYAARTETCLCKCCGVCCAAERRNPTLFARNIDSLCRFHKQIAVILIYLYGTVKVTVIYHKILRVVNCVIRNEHSRAILKFACVSLAPSLRASESCLLTACKDTADFGILKVDSLVLKSLHNCNTHIATGKVIVCTVNYSAIINHPIKTYERNKENKTDKRSLSNRLTHSDCSENAVFDAFDNTKNEIINGTHTAKNSVTLKAYTAELIIHRPFPSGVGVTVKENSALRLTACTLFDCGYIMTCFLREAFVNQLNIKTELAKHDKQTQNNKNNTDNRCKERAQNADKNKGNRKENPTEERTRVLLKTFYLCAFTAAVLFKNLRHILTSLLFTL